MKETAYAADPRTVLPEALTGQLRQYAGPAETRRSLPQEVLDTICEQDWFRLMTPAALGGRELSLPATVQLFEALAWAEANTGWCVNLGAGANMFAGYLDVAVAGAIFNSPCTCCAGSGALSGTARRAEGGYILSGRWKYASGANHATHFTANAWLQDEAGQALTVEEQPVFRSFILPAAQVSNLRNWEALGLKATSSNDFAVDEVWVPESHTFSLLQPSPFASGPLYKFPFSQLALVNMTCMFTGVVLHFLELYTALAAQKKPMHGEQLLKDQPLARDTAGQAVAAFEAARQAMYRELHQVWAPYEEGGELPATAFLPFQAACADAATAARRVLTDLYPLCGMSILAPETTLSKVWRDGMTVSQHYLLSPLYFAAM